MDIKKIIVLIAILLVVGPGLSSAYKRDGLRRGESIYHFDDWMNHFFRMENYDQKNTDGKRVEFRRDRDIINRERGERDKTKEIVVVREEVKRNDAVLRQVSITLIVLIIVVALAIGIILLREKYFRDFRVGKEQ